MSTLAEDFRDWLGDAKPGNCCAYYAGHLARDRDAGPYAPEINDLAKAVMQAAEEGWVTLTQEREGEGVCVYLATRTTEIMG